MKRYCPHNSIQHIQCITKHIEIPFDILPVEDTENVNYESVENKFEIRSMSVTAAFNFQKGTNFYFIFMLHRSYKSYCEYLTPYSDQYNTKSATLLGLNLTKVPKLYFALLIQN